MYFFSSRRRHTRYWRDWEFRRVLFRSDPERGSKEAGRRGIPYEEDLDELLAQGDLDGVVVTTPTTAHREVLLKAVQAGKHIFTEKVLTPSLREADRKSVV